MRKKRIISLLLSSVLVVSINSETIFASERHSTYENNIELSEVENNTARLKKIIKDGETPLVASIE